MYHYFQTLSKIICDYSDYQNKGTNDIILSWNHTYFVYYRKDVSKSNNENCNNILLA